VLVRVTVGERGGIQVAGFVRAESGTFDPFDDGGRADHARRVFDPRLARGQIDLTRKYPRGLAQHALDAAGARSAVHAGDVEGKGGGLAHVVSLWMEDRIGQCSGSP